MGNENSQMTVSDIAPSAEQLTDYDRAHLITYLRLLDAEADKAPWQEVVAIVLGIHPEHGEERARRAYETHLERAHWMAKQGYTYLLRP
ncbi:MAG: DUF2285 domain-containing protein [Methylocystaceae bacterium]|nr:DUF2285 domain-containing protein [Methylocystaceae bacterium]